MPATRLKQQQQVTRTDHFVKCNVLLSFLLVTAGQALSGFSDLLQKTLSQKVLSNDSNKENKSLRNIPGLSNSLVTYPIEHSQYAQRLHPCKPQELKDLNTMGHLQTSSVPAFTG